MIAKLIFDKGPTILRRIGAVDLPQSPFDVLGINYGASDDDIRHAYRKLAKQYHPDKNPGCGQPCVEKLAEINKAKEQLEDRDALPDGRLEDWQSVSAALVERFGWVFLWMMALGLFLLHHHRRQCTLGRAGGGMERGGEVKMPRVPPKAELIRLWMSALQECGIPSTKRRRYAEGPAKNGIFIGMGAGRATNYREHASQGRRRFQGSSSSNPVLHSRCSGGSDWQLPRV